jgi:sterol desaturase/sphingolipid hydroxylase (fatty acid hydroxylase superfamily)
MNYKLCLESCMFTCIQFIPFYFGNIDIYRYSLLYLIHQHVYYAYHRFGHQWSNRQKIGIHSLHHANRRYHNIIEPFGFIHYSIMDQIIPYMLFGS